MCSVPAVFLISFAIWTRTSSANEGEVVCARRGDRVEIPCSRGNKYGENVKWLYNNGSGNKLLLSISKSGVAAHSAAAPSSKINSNNSLVIDDIRKEYEGTYSCEVCVSSGCTITVRSTVSLIRESSLSSAKELKAIAGAVFTHPCPRGTGGDADSSRTLSWTFEPTRKPNEMRKPYRWSISDTSTTGRVSLLSNGSIVLQGVTSFDAGTYSCWRQRQSPNCHWDRLVTINLQVQTAVIDKPGNDSQFGQNRSILCDGVLQQTEISCNYSKHENTREDRQNYNKTAVVCGTSIPCLCILIVLCIISLSKCRRISMTSTSNRSDGGLSIDASSVTRHEVDETQSAVYSLLNVVIPEQNHTIKYQEECIYSLIKMSSASDPFN
ncbi:hypothetical protein GN956_G4300 [Arapaima gigas]